MTLEPVEFVTDKLPPDAPPTYGIDPWCTAFMFDANGSVRTVVGSHAVYVFTVTLRDISPEEVGRQQSLLSALCPYEVVTVVRDGKTAVFAVVEPRESS